MPEKVRIREFFYGWDLTCPGEIDDDYGSRGPVSLDCGTQSLQCRTQGPRLEVPNMKRKRGFN